MFIFLVHGFLNKINCSLLCIAIIPGLCGSNDGKGSNDFTDPNGRSYRSPTRAFIRSWRYVVS